MSLSVGDKLGHCEVLSLLGKGGMEEVYGARVCVAKAESGDGKPRERTSRAARRCFNH
jgi:hypothetical protein